MSIQNSEHRDSHNIDNIMMNSEGMLFNRKCPTIGGPPVPGIITIQATGCTESDMTLYNQVEHAIDCAIAAEGENVTSLGKSIILADIASKSPISCMIDLMTGPYVDCGSEIPEDKRKNAYDAFSDVTGFKQINYTEIFNNLNNQQKDILNFNAFYIFIPVLLLSLIVIWLMVGFYWIDWIAGLFLSGLAFIMLYGASMLYRAHGQQSINNNASKIQSEINTYQENFQNSVAYFPQGMFSVACAVTASTGTTGWRCNPPPNVLSSSESDIIHTSQSCCSSKQNKLNNVPTVSRIQRNRNNNKN